MVTAWIQILERLGDARLERWALGVHFAVLVALTVYWLAPIFAALMRGLPTRPERLWVRLWICPACEQLNRRTYANCQRCQRDLPLRWRDRWEMSAFAERLRKVSGRLSKTSRLVGYFLYYSVPALALVVFGLLRFQQSPLQEIAGSFALSFLLLFFLFIRAAVDAGWRAPVVSFIQVVAGTVMIGGFLSASFLWAATKYPPEKSITTVTLNHEGHIRVRYSVLSWPLLGVRQINILEVGRVPTVKPWIAQVTKHAAERLNGSSDLQPRVMILEQVLTGAPNRSADVIVPSSGSGLVLREFPDPAKPLTKTKK